MKPGDENYPSSRARKPSNSWAIDYYTEMAEQLKDVYTMCRRSYESYMYGRRSNYTAARKYDKEKLVKNRTYTNTWVYLAKQLHAEKIDPCHYVEAIFTQILGTKDPMPLPQELLQMRFREIYQRSLREHNVEDLRNALASQLQALTTQVAVNQSTGKTSMESAMISALCCEALAFSSLFRYCISYRMAREAKRKQDVFQRIADQYEVGAAVQYVRSAKGYDAAWGDMLPGKFRNQASRLYDAATIICVMYGRDEEDDDQDE